MADNDLKTLKLSPRVQWPSASIFRVSATEKTDSGTRKFLPALSATVPPPSSATGGHRRWRLGHGGEFLEQVCRKVYIIHRRDAFRASKIMQKRALDNPKIEVIWNTEVLKTTGNERGFLNGLNLRNTVNNEESVLFFAIGHEPATKFLEGQLELDSDGDIKTKPGTTQTSIGGVFTARDVQDKKWRQAITVAGTGCMSALEVEHFLQEIAAEEDSERDSGTGGY